MNKEPSQHIVLSNNKHALIVMLICFLPHFTTAPWWLYIIVLASISYRLLADYYGLSQLSHWTRLGLVVVSITLLKVHYGSIFTGGFFIGFLLTFVALKCIEIHTIRDVKVLIFCNFYLIFSALIVNQDLWILIYLLVAVLANFSLMLKLTAPEASLKQIGSKSTKQLLIAIPLSILLFYLFPRIAEPLWQVPSISGNHIGFSENMNPGSISELFDDTSIAMRVTFKNKPNINGYWRGVILSYYQEETWRPGFYNTLSFISLPELTPDQTADYEIILEPHQKKWLFYLGYPEAAQPHLLFAPNNGLTNENKEAVTQRFAYSLKIKAPPFQSLSKKEIMQNTQLPRNSNPRLTTWSREQFHHLHENQQAFIQYLGNYIKENDFWYSLSPPSLGSNDQQMDSFWFDTQKGFCEHYASAVTVILRSVGIPARVIIGYQGGKWNPIGKYLTIQHNNAHAWLEYWHPGIGWQQFDPTSFIAPERIEQSIRDQQITNFDTDEYTNTMHLSLFDRIKLSVASARFFAERWLLFYNQSAQQELLKKLGLEQWGFGTLLKASVGSVILFILLTGLGHHWWQRRKFDHLAHEYHLLQKQFRRFNVPTYPAATLKHQCTLLAQKIPNLTDLLHTFLYQYEQLRLQKPTNDPQKNRKDTLILFKNLRQTLSQLKPSRSSTAIASDANIVLK